MRRFVGRLILVASLSVLVGYFAIVLPLVFVLHLTPIAGFLLGLLVGGFTPLIVLLIPPVSDWVNG